MMIAIKKKADIQSNHVESAHPSREEDLANYQQGIVTTGLDQSELSTSRCYI